MQKSEKEGSKINQIILFSNIVKRIGVCSGLHLRHTPSTRSTHVHHPRSVRMSSLQNGLAIIDSSCSKRLRPHHHWSLLLLPSRWKSVKWIAAPPINYLVSTHLCPSHKRLICLHDLLWRDTKRIGCSLLVERIWLLLLSHHDILFLDVECHHLLHKHLLLLLNLHHLLLRLKLVRLWGLLVHHLSGGSDSPGQTWVVHLEEVNILWSCLLGGGWRWEEVIKLVRWGGCRRRGWLHRVRMLKLLGRLRALVNWRCTEIEIEVHFCLLLWRRHQIVRCLLLLYLRGVISIEIEIVWLLNLLITRYFLLLGRSSRGLFCCQIWTGDKREFLRGAFILMVATIGELWHIIDT